MGLDIIIYPFFIFSHFIWDRDKPYSWHGACYPNEIPEAKRYVDTSWGKIELWDTGQIGTF